MNINLFWLDGDISMLEKLTIRSILGNNNIPVIWAYDLSKFCEFKKDVILQNANDIIKKEDSFIYKGLGNTRASFGCGFTDIFRAKLLYEVGGWYSDFDITFLSDLTEYKEDYVFRKHNITCFVPNLIKAPAKCDFLKELYEVFIANINENNTNFFKPLILFSNLIKKYKLEQFGVDDFGLDNANEIVPLFIRNINPKLKAVHWCNELFKNVGYDMSSFIGELKNITLLKNYNLINNKKIYFNWNKPIENSFYSNLIKKYEV